MTAPRQPGSSCPLRQTAFATGKPLKGYQRSLKEWELSDLKKRELVAKLLSQEVELLNAPTGPLLGLRLPASGSAQKLDTTTNGGVARAAVTLHNTSARKTPGPVTSLLD